MICDHIIMKFYYRKYMLKKKNREEIWSVVTNASHTDWQTSKDRATQLLKSWNGAHVTQLAFVEKKIHTLEYVFMRAASEWLCGRCTGKTIKLCLIGFQLKFKVFAIPKHLLVSAVALMADFYMVNRMLRKVTKYVFFVKDIWMTNTQGCWSWRI